MYNVKIIFKILKKKKKLEKNTFLVFLEYFLKYFLHGQKERF